MYPFFFHHWFIASYYQIHLPNSLKVSKYVENPEWKCYGDLGKWTYMYIIHYLLQYTKQFYVLINIKNSIYKDMFYLDDTHEYGEVFNI